MLTGSRKKIPEKETKTHITTDLLSKLSNKTTTKLLYFRCTEKIWYALLFLKLLQPIPWEKVCCCWAILILKKKVSIWNWSLQFHLSVCMILVLMVQKLVRPVCFDICLISQSFLFLQFHDAIQKTSASILLSFQILLFIICSAIFFTGLLFVL